MSTPFTFIHAADLHLGTPFSGVGESSPAMAALLREATLGAFDNLVELCLAENAAFLVIAGDVYDGPERSIATLARFMAGVKKLGAAGIKVFVATGNHDPSMGRAWSAMGDPPENLVLFPAKPTCHQVTLDGLDLAVVHGVGYHGKAVKEDLAAKIRRSRPGGFEVGVLHATVGLPAGHESYAPTTLDTLIGSGLDYWALGHVHTRSVLREALPAVCYPGNTQALSGREEGARGASVVRVDASGRSSIEFRPLDLVRFSTVAVNLGDMDNPAELISLLEENARNAAMAAEGRALILNLLLAGRSPLFHELSRPGELEELTVAVREGLAACEPPLWLNRLENNLAPELDLDRIAEAATVEGEVARRAGELSADPALLAETLQRLSRDLLKKPDVRKLLADQPDLGEMERELTGALNLALDLLTGREP